MVEQPKSSAGVEKSSSLKNLKKESSRGESPTGKPPSQLNKNPSQKAGDLSPLNTKQGEGSQGSSIRRNQRNSKRGSNAGESDSPTKRMNSNSKGANALGDGRQATKVANRQKDL